MTDQLNSATIHWDGDGQPISTAYDDVYFSRASGIDESRHVFLRHNHLPDRWGQLDPEHSGHFTIAETGFGTGLNFLTAVDLWLKTAPESWRLHFVSAEKFPLTPEDLKKALALWPELAELSSELQPHYPPAIPGTHRLHLFGGRVMLTLLFGEAAEMFEGLKGCNHPLWKRHGNPVIDAWFLDGFAPSKNPDMWTKKLFSAISDLSDTGSTFATFTCAGIVRRGLHDVGFTIEKVPGFGHKREMARGTMEAAPEIELPTEALEPNRRNAKHPAPWHLNTNRRTEKHSAVILGGGIAGCSAAEALVRRGWRVTLVERHRELGSEASGNPQGITYPKFSKQDSDLSRYGLYGLIYASRFYRPLWSEGKFGQQCGVLLLPDNQKQQADFHAIGDRFGNAQDFVKKIEGDELQAVSGLPLTASVGLYCPQLGWVVPPEACRWLANKPGIEHLQADVNRIQQVDGQWQLIDQSGHCIIETETLILASAHYTKKIEQTAHLPLKSIRGQISQVTTEESQLTTVICGKGYIAPALNGSYTLGATYNLRDDCTELRDSDHQTNLERLTKTDSAIGDIIPDSIDGLEGRVGFRCTTPDYLPIIGPAPIKAEMETRFELFKKNARSDVPLPGVYHQGLFVSCGYGSRGLSYAPLGAELLAAQICAEVPPVEQELAQALSPARFLIRNLKRGDN